MQNWKVLAEEAVNFKIGTPPPGAKMGPEEGTGILIVARVNPYDETSLSQLQPIEIGMVDVGDNKKVKFSLDDAIEGKRTIANRTELKSGFGIDIPVTVFFEDARYNLIINVKSYEDFDPKSILSQLRKMLLFRLDLEFAEGLNAGEISESLGEVFKTNSISLPDGAKVVRDESEEGIWWIQDETENPLCTIKEETIREIARGEEARDEDKRLNVYKEKNRINDLMTANEALMEFNRRLRADKEIGLRITRRLQAALPQMLPGASSDPQPTGGQ